MRISQYLFLLLINLPAFLQAQQARLTLEKIIYRQLDGYPTVPRAVKADAGGGTLDFDVTYRQFDNCLETYRFQWKFDRDMTTLELGATPGYYGFEMKAEVLNGNCGMLTPWRNPYVLAGGQYGNYAPILEQEEPKYQSAANVLHGGSQQRLYFRDDDWVKRNRERVGYLRDQFSTRLYADFSGEYTWLKFDVIAISNTDLPENGFKYEIVYIYRLTPPSQQPKGNEPVTPVTNVARRQLELGAPRLQPNVQNDQGSMFLGIQVPGNLPASTTDSQFQLIVRFVDGNNQPIRANPEAADYQDENGLAISASPVYKIPLADYELDKIQLWFPYYAFNLPKRGIYYTLYLYGELYINGQLTAISKRVPFSVLW